MGIVSEADVLYSVLPMYHSAGVAVCQGNTLTEGLTMVTRKKLSANKFWEDCVRNKVTVCMLCFRHEHSFFYCLLIICNCFKGQNHQKCLLVFTFMSCCHLYHKVLCTNLLDFSVPNILEKLQDIYMQPQSLHMKSSIPSG